MRLVDSLCRQIDGSVVIESGPQGTRTEVRFRHTPVPLVGAGAP